MFNCARFLGIVRIYITHVTGIHRFSQTSIRMHVTKMIVFVRKEC